MPLRAFLFSLRTQSVGLGAYYTAGRNALAGVFVFSPSCRCGAWWRVYYVAMPLRAFLFSLERVYADRFDDDWRSRNALAGVFVFSPRGQGTRKAYEDLRRNALAGVFVFSQEEWLLDLVQAQRVAMPLRAFLFSLSQHRDPGGGTFY